MRPHGCPSLEELSSLADGTAPADVADSLLEHVECCPSCAATLSKIETRPNTFVRAVAGDPHRTWQENSLRLQRQIHSADATPAVDHDQSDTPEMRRVEGDEPGRQISPSFSASTGAGRFTKLRHHAQGGLGLVSLARDEELHREVALKEIQPRYADRTENRQRFVREAEITGGLEHPGIVPVYSLGADAKGRPYYAMRMIQGESLAEAVAQFHAGHPSAPQSRRFESVEFRKLLGRFIAVCQAMEYAHSRGVLHRDLKPANIMVGAYGETLVVDWGLAKKRSGKESAGDDATPGIAAMSDLTQPGAAMGTPAYMSPEQADGNPSQLTPASDLYSLGATLFTLLTGKRAFEGRDVSEVLEKVKAGRFPRPRQLAPDLPRALEAICLKAMSYTPSARQDSAAALADDLERYLADEPVACCPESWPTRAQRWARRHRALVASGAVGAVALLLALASGLGLAAQHNRQLLAEQVKTEQANIELSQSNTDLVKQTNHAFASAHALRSLLVNRELDSGNLYLANRLLEQQRPSVEDPVDRRGWEWRYLSRQLHAPLRRINIETERVQAIKDGRTNSAAISGVWGLAMSPEGRQIAMAGYGRVRLYDAATGGLLNELPIRPMTAARCVAFSPNGKWLVAGGGDLLFQDKHSWLVAWEVGAWDSPKELMGHTEVVNCVAVHPEGRWIASGSRDKTVRIWDVQTGATVRVLPALDGQGGPAGQVAGVAFSPNGETLATAGTADYVRLWNTADGKLVRELFETPGGADCVTFAPDGKSVAAGGHDGIVRLWNTDSGRLIEALRGHTKPVSAIVFHGGSHVTTASHDGSIRQWNRETGGEIRSINVQSGSINSLVLEPLGWRLFSGGDGISILDAERDADHRLQPAWNPVLTGTALFLPGSERVAYPHQLGISVWDLKTGRTQSQPGIHPLPLANVAVSSDGALLATSCYGLGDVKVFDTATRRELRSIKGDTGLAHGPAFSPDGQWLATCGVENQQLRVWNLRDPAQDFELAKPEDTDYRSLVFHPRDGLLVCGGSQTDVYDIAQRKIVWSIPDQKTTLRISFVEDGNRLITAGGNGRVQIWDWQSRTMLHEVVASGRGFDWSIGVAYASEGPRLFVGGGTTVRVFDLNTNLEVLSIPFSAEVTDVVLSPDQQRLVVLTRRNIRVLDARELIDDQLRTREAESLAYFLARQPLTREQVKDRVQSGQLAVETSVLDEAMTWFDTLPDNPERFNNAAWLIARKPGQAITDYERARAYALEALKLAPDNAAYLNTLGVCEFRLGNDQAAIEQLEKSKVKNGLRLGPQIRFNPSDLAFLAMSYHRLGNVEQSKLNLQSLRLSMSMPQFKSQRESRELLAEAEELLNQSASPSTP